MPIVYSGQPLPETSLKTVQAFNKRALIALRGAPLTEWDKTFLPTIASLVEHYEQLGLARQNVLARMVVRHADHLHDKAVVDFAVMAARGAD